MAPADRAAVRKFLSRLRGCELEVALEQVTVAIAIIDALEAQIAPDKELRAYARRQAGCKALTAHYGIGPLVIVMVGTATPI